MNDDSTQTNILVTKLHRPPLSADYIPRNEILEQLEKYRQCPFSLVSAPAGYGKSILISSWIEK